MAHSTDRVDFNCVFLPKPDFVLSETCFYHRIFAASNGLFDPFDPCQDVRKTAKSQYAYCARRCRLVAAAEQRVEAQGSWIFASGLRLAHADETVRGKARTLAFPLVARSHLAFTASNAHKSTTLGSLRVSGGGRAAGEHSSRSEEGLEG
eukprot:703536-Pleurochrysis_carterae.AAC.3